MKTRQMPPKKSLIHQRFLWHLFFRCAFLCYLQKRMSLPYPHFWCSTSFYTSHLLKPHSSLRQEWHPLSIFSVFWLHEGHCTSCAPFASMLLPIPYTSILQLPYAAFQ